MNHTAQYALAAAILTSSMLAAVAAKKLTVPAALTGGMVGCFVFMGAGFTGIALVAVFFALGTGATSWKKNFKIANGLMEATSSRRNAGQVLANAGVAGLCGLLVFLVPAYTALLQVLLAASLAAAAADTLASELGNVYGRRFYNILSFKKDQRGLDGVVSLEGTLLGGMGSCIIALTYAAGFGFGWRMFFILVVSGTVGNLMDSLLGGLLERRGILKNDQVNFLNTLSAALCAWLLYSLMIG